MSTIKTEPQEQIKQDPDAAMKEPVPVKQEPSTPPPKTSMEILAELFSSFDAEPPVIVKKEEPGDEDRKHRKKHKKHHKKEKKRKRHRSSSRVVDLAEVLIKSEREAGLEEKKVKEELEKRSGGGKIVIKNLKLSSVLEATITKEKSVAGDSSEDDERKKSKDRHRKESRKRHRSHEDLKSREDKYKSKSGYDSDRKRRKVEIDRCDRWRRRSSERQETSSWRIRDSKSKTGNKSSEESASQFDKKKLLEIARKNALQMMKFGSLPGAATLGAQAREKFIAAIKAGGKTVEELTEFCKTLSRKEELDELSSGDDSDTGAFNHPFRLKERPATITLNIKNSVPLPTKTLQERTSDLSMQFPVSSGQLHRKGENEWVPVPQKKAEVKQKQVAAFTEKAAKEAAVEEPNIDISQIVSQRLSAIRKLQENPNDVQAITEMYKVQKNAQNWAESKQMAQQAQFTGSTGAQILSAAELSAGHQAWAKKNQLQSAAPLSGGMGMHLLQKMGWKPGEGLGKEKSGALEPLLLEVKLDKRGLVANEEHQPRPPKKTPSSSSKCAVSKHPVSLLGEYASKMKLGAPEYGLCFECGPDHKKNFLFKVVVNGVEYKPNVASPNKKEAKAMAATVCLQQLGVLQPIVAPPVSIPPLQ